MLYMIGILAMDTGGLSADGVNRKFGVDIAKKAVIGGLPSTEFTGEREERLNLTGQLLPYHLGGLSTLEIARTMMLGGVIVPVIRGDGVVFGDFVITSLSEAHKQLSNEGVGFVVSYSINLLKVDGVLSSATSYHAKLIPELLSLF